MATHKTSKVQIFKSVTLRYKCGCFKDVKKMNVIEIDKQMEFASKVRCEECCK
jgi:hypothetical protein